MKEHNPFNNSFYFIFPFNVFTNMNLNYYYFYYFASFNCKDFYHLPSHKDFISYMDYFHFFVFYYNFDQFVLTFSLNFNNSCHNYLFHNYFIY